MSSTQPFSSLSTEADTAATILRTTVAVRERAVQLLNRARMRESDWFTIDDGKMDTAASAIVQAARKRYPKLRIPLHSRWRHFEAGGIDRKAQLGKMLLDLPEPLRGHALIDLAFVSVLLDAGAGPDWKYVEPVTGQTFTRSEGLAVASYHAFVGGMFSSDKSRPLQADITGLRALATEHLATAFQASESNPLVGLPERAILLRRFGEVMQDHPEVFGQNGRPSGLFNTVVTPFGSGVSHTANITAHTILSQILFSLSDIWPNGNSVGSVALGDCWRHPAVRGEGLSDGWTPFHQRSQWLTYSLIEPFQWSGVAVRGLNRLTALPDCRNGGLLLDTGLVRLREGSASQQVWQPGDAIIVEWRALTVALLDELAQAVRRQLRLSEAQLPLACVLEGGSWVAGRELAQRLRGGLPPLQVASDETVF